jgi:hypothetical protein
MKKKSGERVEANADELEIPPLSPGFFRRAVQGKYYSEMMNGSNVVRIAPDLVKIFPNERTVNDALRLVKQLRDVGKPARRKTA